MQYILKYQLGGKIKNNLNWRKLKLRVNSRGKGRSFEKYASHTEHLSSVCKEYPVRNFHCVFLILLVAYIFYLIANFSYYSDTHHMISEIKILCLNSMMECFS